MSAPLRPPSSFGRRPRGGGVAAAERRQVQTANESALTTAARKTGMSEEQVLELALARSAWKSMVVVQLMSAGTQLDWSRTPLPAIVNLEAVLSASIFPASTRTRFSQRHRPNSAGAR